MGNARKAVRDCPDEAAQDWTTGGFLASDRLGQ
jgi:hypothetical protein